MIRVLSVEDDPLVQSYLTARLSSEPDIEVVGQVASAGAACGFLRQNEADVVLLDYQLGTADGLQLLQAISLWFEEVPAEHCRPVVLFCTGYGGSEFEARARAMGAEGVVAKQRASTELVPAVRSVAAGGCWFGDGRVQSAAAVKSGRGNVLVTAQDRVIRGQLSEALLGIDCLVSHAWRSDEVLSRLEGGAVDLLLLDDRLPGRASTTNLLQEIHSRFPTLPVVFMVALPEGMDQYSAGPNVRATMKKPVSVGRLQEEVALILPLRR